MSAVKNNILINMGIVLFTLGFFSLLILGITTPALAREATGWHWYNETYQEDTKDKAKNEKVKKEASAAAQVLMLRQAVQEAKAKAILYPTIENMRSYLMLQNFVTNQAGMFTRAWKQALLAYPELDYSVLHPTQNSAQHVMYAETSRKETEAIKAFSAKYGLFFFYRGNEALDKELAPTIEAFSKENNISLMPVSVDGKQSDVFATSQINRGHAEKLGVKHFPALVLVDPKTQKVVPLHYGFISDSELRRRFLQVATEFQEGV